MSPTCDPSCIKVPTWVASVLKIAVPLLIVLASSYVGFLILQSDVTCLKAQVPELARRVDCIEKESYKESTATSVFKVNVNESLARIEKSIGEIRSELKSVNGAQQTILFDVRVVQEKLKEIDRKEKSSAGRDQ